VSAFIADGRLFIETNDAESSDVPLTLPTCTTLQGSELVPYGGYVTGWSRVSGGADHVIELSDTGC
jgi:hypothetical protein